MKEVFNREWVNQITNKRDKTGRKKNIQSESSIYKKTLYGPLDNYILQNRVNDPLDVMTIWEGSEVASNLYISQQSKSS